MDTVEGCFNSILVRLKGTGTTGAITTSNLFQFHTGSIKRRETLISVSKGVLFQFHTGSIKSPSENTTSGRAYVRFNSILVRLKVDLYKKQKALKMCFNSILVRLKAAGSVTPENSVGVSFNSILVRLKAVENVPAVTAFICFNSILVRLKGSLLPLQIQTGTAVSIPYWFD